MQRFALEFVSPTTRQRGTRCLNTITTLNLLLKNSPRKQRWHALKMNNCYLGNNLEHDSQMKSLYNFNTLLERLKPKTENLLLRL